MTADPTDPQESVIRTILSLVMEREGGVVTNPTESYVTRWGQTPGWLSRWRLPVPTAAAEAEMNYRSWLEQTNLDALCTEADSLPDIVIDWAIHSGERVAISSLQRVLHVKADGVLGPVTMTALAICDRAKVARHVLADRLESTNGLIADHPEKYAVYARGWGRRIGSQIRSLS